MPDFGQLEGDLSEAVLLDVYSDADPPLAEGKRNDPHREDDR
jgi:hypothetical protein